MQGREKAVLSSGVRTQSLCKSAPQTDSSEFGIHVFGEEHIVRSLPEEIARNVINASNGIEAINPSYADTIAVAIKEWAMGLGATHYTHWFQPLTGSSAEKHEAFIDWSYFPHQVVEKFSGSQLIQGEPDASSFPSGGLRSTYEARGYTGWDPSSPIFVWKGGDGVTLCIPSVFFSWTGDVLDAKIPLIRSERKLGDQVMRLLNLTGLKVDYVFTTLGLEQEYFVIERSFKKLRPDLLLAGRTVFGAPSPKGQELQDHYFGSVKDRVLTFMRAFERKALRLGIPVKMRHNEVAPHQHEVAPVFEKTIVAVDHNLLLMEIMRQTAEEQGLSCLLHEKPFAGINGSGKHSNWSIGTNTGVNLLDPTDTPENQLHFLVLITAILDGVFRHNELLRASIGSASNDWRLGGHEAPPAIISVYLGKTLETFLENIEKAGKHQSTKEKGTYQFALTTVPEISKHDTDRNRTSPFAFTGNKFEFRAVGSSSNPAFAITCLNAAVADSLEEMMNEIEKALGEDTSKEAFVSAMISVVQKVLMRSKPIRFSGDNYSKEWLKEAEKRGVRNLVKSPEAFLALKEPKTAKAFKGILTSSELLSRYDIFAETYIQTTEIDVRLMLDLFKTVVYPAAIRTQKEYAKALSEYLEVTGHKKAPPAQLALLEKLSHAIEEALMLSNELEDLRRKIADIKDITLKSQMASQELLDKADELRAVVDFIETLADDSEWPLPKYREILFLI